MTSRRACCNKAPPPPVQSTSALTRPTGGATVRKYSTKSKTKLLINIDGDVEGEVRFNVHCKVVT